MAGKPESVFSDGGGTKKKQETNKLKTLAPPSRARVFGFLLTIADIFLTILNLFGTIYIEHRVNSQAYLDAYYNRHIKLSKCQTSNYPQSQKNIRQYRKEKSFSQDRLSKEAEVAHNTIVKIESGENPNSTIDTLERITKASRHIY